MVILNSERKHAVRYPRLYTKWRFWSSGIWGLCAQYVAEFLSLLLLWSSWGWSACYLLLHCSQQHLVLYSRSLLVFGLVCGHDVFHSSVILSISSFWSCSSVFCERKQRVDMTVVAIFGLGHLFMFALLHACLWMLPGCTLWLLTFQLSLVNQALLIMFSCVESQIAAK